MKFSFSVVYCSATMILAISASTAVDSSSQDDLNAIIRASSDEDNISSDDDNHSFSLVGHGSCTQRGKMYDSVTFTNIDDIELCASSRYCGHSQVRGFSYSERGHNNNNDCVCYFDHGYDSNTIPQDMKGLQGYEGFVADLNVVVGAIHESDEHLNANWNCYSNHNFKNPYTFIGNGACFNKEKELYDFVSYDDVMKLELCGSPVYCGRPHVRGFTYDDTNHCICYFEDGWKSETIPQDMKERKGYNPLGVYFGNTATGEIMGSDQGSLFRKCYANTNFAFRTIKSLRGIGLQVR